MSFQAFPHAPSPLCTSAARVIAHHIISLESGRKAIKMNRIFIRMMAVEEVRALANKCSSLRCCQCHNAEFQIRNTEKARHA